MCVWVTRFNVPNDIWCFLKFSDFSNFSNFWGNLLRKPRGENGPYHVCKGAPLVYLLLFLGADFDLKIHTKHEEMTGMVRVVEVVQIL